MDIQQDSLLPPPRALVVLPIHETPALMLIFKDYTSYGVLEKTPAARIKESLKLIFLTSNPFLDWKKIN